MNYNRSHTYCVKDENVFLLKSINQVPNRRIKVAKNLERSDCFVSNKDCDLCYDIGASNSCEDEQNFSKDHLKKQNKSHRSGSVYKIPLGKEFVKSSPCLEYANFDYDKAVIVEATENPRIHRKKTLRHKSKYIEDDIDFIPVKLTSSDKVFPFKTNDKMKMNSARQNFNSRSPERKVNSWGKILKEQNVSTKDPKKNTIAVAQNIKQKVVTTKNQPQLQAKPKSTNYEIPVQQSKFTKTKPAPRDSYPVMRKKSSQRTMKFEPPQRSEYSSGSGSSITGESIMLVDRSAQCSVANFEMLEPNNCLNNFNDVNQAGDSGLAYLNPVRTLNFLVRELRGKVSEGSEDDNMSRIIRDMENTIGRLSRTPQGNLRDNWNTIINEDDLKSVLELLQNTPPSPPQVNKILESDIQQKLEGTCNKLEELCKQMEKTTCNKLREDKKRLSSELFAKTSELEAAILRETEQERIIAELKKKNEEQSKQIASLRENQSKAAALNAILNEQLQDTEKKYQQVVTEMQFLLLEKEKNLVLMKCKDQDIQDMRKNLEEIKSLVVQHLSSFQLESTNSGTALGKENKLDFDNMTLLSTLSTTVLHKNMKEIKDELPVCSSPVETLSPSPDEDDSWRKISNVPMTAPDSPTQFEEPPVLMVLDPHIPPRPQTSKTLCIKESLKNLFEEMKKQTKLGKNLSIQNLINLEESGAPNWSDLDFSDDEIRSMTGYVISESDTSK